MTLWRGSCAIHEPVPRSQGVRLGDHLVRSKHLRVLAEIITVVTPASFARLSAVDGYRRGTGRGGFLGEQSCEPPGLISHHQSRKTTRDDHNGTLPCFFHGFLRSLLRSIASARATRFRVSRR